MNEFNKLEQKHLERYEKVFCFLQVSAMCDCNVIHEYVCLYIYKILMNIRMHLGKRRKKTGILIYYKFFQLEREIDLFISQFLMRLKCQETFELVCFKIKEKSIIKFYVCFYKTHSADELVKLDSECF